MFRLRVKILQRPATVAQWLRRRAAEPKDAGSIPAAVAAFLVEAKTECARVPRFQHILKIPWWSKLIQSPLLQRMEFHTNIYWREIWRNRLGKASLR